MSFGYADESDPGPYPIPPNAPIEGGSSSTGDRHVLVVDRDACRLWELYSAYPQNGGASWTAGSGATWSLNSNAMRPLGWTSGDAAGLPILPGLVRYDEVAAGEIDHVIRFTAPRTASAYVWPASHKAETGGASDPPMGAWLRLKASYDISRLLGAEPGDPPRAQEARDGPRRQRLVALHERRARSGLERLRPERPEDGARLGVRGGRRVEPEGVEHVVCRGGRVSSAPASAATATAATAASTALRRLRASSSPTPASRPASPAGGRATTARRSRAPASLPTPARARPSSVARGTRVTRLLDDSPDTVASTVTGATYAGSAWVLAPAGRTVSLRVRELNGSSVVRSTVTTGTGDGGWHQLVVSTAAASGRHPSQRRGHGVADEGLEGPRRRRVA